LCFRDPECDSLDIRGPEEQIWYLFRPVNSHWGDGDSFCDLYSTLFPGARPQSTHRVAIADFWRIIHQDGKISPGWGGGGGGARPLLFTLFPITYKVLVYSTLQLRVQIHSPYFSSLPLYVICWLGRG
jgi:hypothetical protein